MVPLGFTAAASVTDAAIQQTIFGSGRSTLILSNENLNDIMKIVKSLEDTRLLKKSVSETVENEVNLKKGGFLCMLTAALGNILLVNLLTDKGVAKDGSGGIRTGEGVIWPGERQDF